jgi:hypothetical protein
MFRQEQRVWISRPSLRNPCLSELEASLLAMEQQNKEMASLKHDLVRKIYFGFERFVLTLKVIFTHE